MVQVPEPVSSVDVDAMVAVSNGGRVRVGPVVNAEGAGVAPKSRRRVRLSLDPHFNKCFRADKSALFRFNSILPKP